MKKIYQLSLAAALLLSPTFAATSFAQTLLGESWSTGTSFEMPTGVDGASAYVSYKLKGSQAIVTGMNMSYTSVKIPASFTYAGTKYTVVGIADNAFNTTDGKKITSITLPSTITKIGKYAFSAGTLTSITLPSSLQEIGSYAFYNNDGLKSLTIPASVTTINESAFENCDYITSLTFSGTSKCKTIGNGAFRYIGYYTAIASVNIPNSVTSLGSDVFQYAKIKSLTLGTGITTLPALATSSTNFSGTLESITMNGVQAIPDNAFKGYTKLTSVSMSAVKTIGASAFENTGIIGIEIPATVTSIGAKAFANCASLKNVKFLMKSGTVGSQAFLDLSSEGTVTAEYTNYFTVDYADKEANPAYYTGGVKNLSGNWMTAPNFSNSTKIGTYAFFGNEHVEKVTSSTIKSIGTYAFGNSKIKTLDLTSASGVSVGFASFYNCELATVTNSQAITSVGNYAFALSKLSTFNAGGLKTISNYCFANCLELATITGTTGLTTIGDYAFQYDAKLTSTIGFSINLTSIGSFAFRGCTSITNLDFYGGLTTIGESAFDGCKGVTAVYMPSSLKTIGKNAFSGCENLHKMVVGDIASYCKVEMVNQTSSPLYMYEGSLYTGGSTGSTIEVTKLEIPASVKNINYVVFAGCKNVKELIVNEGVETIGSYSFAYMKGLTNITLPSTLKTLYANAFDSAGTNATALTVTCNATTVPTAQTTSFNNMTFSKATLNVPADTKSKYSVATGWKNFASKTVQNCAAPEISTLNGKVVFKTTTLGAKVMYSVEYGGTSSSSVTTDSSTGTATSTWITPSLKITAYATKADHANSPTVTKTITLNTPGLKGDVNLDGVVNIADVTAVVNAALGK